MTYNTMEEAALAVLRKLDNYDSQNSSRGDYRVLASGITRAVIMEPGNFDRRFHAYPRVIQTSWQMLFSLHVNWGGSPVEAGSRIRTDRQEIIDHFDKYPTLDGVVGCIEAFITGGRDPEMWGGENNTWWRQEIVLAVTENTSVTIAE